MLNPVRGTRGMVTAPHSLAAQSGLAVLREGGNALEAMIAAAASIAVVYPHMNGIGGDSFWLVHAPGQGVKALDAAGVAAAGVRPETYIAQGLKAIPFRGPGAAITVAGTVSGWARAHAHSREAWGGTLPLSRLLADAIQYARAGIPVTQSQASNTAKKMPELVPQPGFAETFLHQGAAPAVGDLFVQPRMAATLDRLAHAGMDDFYQGDLARSIAADLESIGSPVRLSDLQNHAAVWKKALELKHSTGTIYNQPPSTQGVISLIILGLMDRLNVTATDHLSADYVHKCVESVKRAFQVRDQYVTDPKYMLVDPQSLLAADNLDAMAHGIDPGRALPWGAGKGPADTIWMGAIDSEGRAVSFIQSIYHEFGSGVVLKQSGINWQNRGASFSLDPKALNPLQPNRKPFHTLNPAMALLNDGRTMVYGNMGGDGQPQSQSAVFSRTIQFGMNPAAAIAAPRWLLGRTWGQTTDTLKLEGRFPAATIDELRRRGHDIEVYPDFDETLGHAGAIVRAPNGTLEGGTDPRSDGAVAGF
jgi:oxamate amidohydrolase